MNGQEEIVNNLRTLEKCLYLETIFAEDISKYDNLIVTEEYKYYILYDFESLFRLVTEFFQRMVNNKIFCINDLQKREIQEILIKIKGYTSILPGCEYFIISLNSSIVNYYNTYEEQH